MDTRERLIKISIDHNLSHMGSCLTALPIIEEIYAIKKPEEKFVLSSGHAHLAHAVVLESLGKGNAEEMLEKGNIHCEREVGCDVSAGSLGQGLPIAVGLALADKNKTVFCLVSDGELAEGSCWEALRIAQEQNLTNLKVYVNANGYGAYRTIDLDRLEKQLEATGFPVDFRRTNSELGVWATGIHSHYKPADKELYAI
jgi:transketolase